VFFIAELTKTHSFRLLFRRFVHWERFICFVILYYAYELLTTDTISYKFVSLNWLRLDAFLGSLYVLLKKSHCVYGI